MVSTTVSPKQYRAARQHLIDCAAAHLRQRGGEAWQALNMVAGEWRNHEDGTLGRMARDVFMAETENDQQYDRLCRAVRRAK